MITNKYKPKISQSGDSILPAGTDVSTSTMSPSAEAVERAKKSSEGRTYVYERPLPADSLLRITEDFSPVYEMVFRAGITDLQSRATLRTIERIHREKSQEMANWTEAMRRAEAEKHRALKRIQDDMEVDQLRAQLKVMKNRLEEKSKELSDNASFMQQVAALRTNYEKERGKQHDMLESPQRASHSTGVREQDGMFSSARQSTGKKQKLYQALHYSALYEPPSGHGEPCIQHGLPSCAVCSGTDSQSSSLVASPAQVNGGRTSNTPTPLKVHERYFHQRPAPSLNFSPAKSQLNPLKSGRSGGTTPVDVASFDEGNGGTTSSRGTPFGIAKKQL